jgi:hypothetical protein
MSTNILASEINALRERIKAEVAKRKYYGSLTTKNGYDTGLGLDTSTSFSAQRGDTASWSLFGELTHG